MLQQCTTVIVSDLPPGRRSFLGGECTLPGGGEPERGGGGGSTLPQGGTYPGGKQEKHTHHTHETWKERKEEEEKKEGEEKEEAEKEEEEGEEESTWACLARPDGAGSSTKRACLIGNNQSRRPRCARWPEALGARRTSSVKSLTLCATPGRSVPTGAKCEGVERQRCSVSTRKPFGTGHLTRKPSTPGCISGKNTYPGGKSRKRGGGLFLFRKKNFPPGVDKINHASRPKTWWGEGGGYSARA